jgi:hypothetical protein
VLICLSGRRWHRYITGGVSLYAMAGVQLCLISAAQASTSLEQLGLVARTEPRQRRHILAELATPAPSIINNTTRSACSWKATETPGRDVRSNPN